MQHEKPRLKAGVFVGMHPTAYPRFLRKPTAAPTNAELRFPPAPGNTSRQNAEVSAPAPTAPGGDAGEAGFCAGGAVGRAGAAETLWRKGHPPVLTSSNRLSTVLSIAGQVLTFRTRARLSFAPPPCRMPLGQSQDIPQADPGKATSPSCRQMCKRFSSKNRPCTAPR